MSATPEIAYVYLKTCVFMKNNDCLAPVSPADFQHGDGAHVITAWNPGGQRLEAPDNTAADSQLRDHLDRRELEPVRVRGADPSSDHYEDGWLVHGLRDDEAREIGAKFGQVAVFRLANARQTVLACTDEWSVSRSLHLLSANDIQTGHESFNEGGLRTWQWFVGELPGGPRLESVHDRSVVLTFLNRWGCRLKRGDGRFPSMTEKSLESWWSSWAPVVKEAAARPLESLHVAQIDRIADAYWDLRSRPASSRRSIGPTAASKVILALSPDTFPAWDRSIAMKLYGGTSRDCYWMHLASAARWSAELRENPQVKALVNSETRVGMGKLIDQTLYRFISRADGVKATTLSG